MAKRRHRRSKVHHRKWSRRTKKPPTKKVKRQRAQAKIRAATQPKTKPVTFFTEVGKTGDKKVKPIISRKPRRRIPLKNYKIQPKQAAPTPTNPAPAAPTPAPAQPVTPTIQTPTAKVQIGNLTLEIRDPDEDPAIRATRFPSKAKAALYDDWQHVLRDVDIAYNQHVPIALVGVAGTGKTEAVYAYGAKKNLPVYRVNFSRGVTEAKLIGSIQEHKGTTFFNMGEVVQAYKNGGILLLDEINLGPPDVTDRLNDILEPNQDMIQLPEAGGLVVKRHPDFFPVATYNPLGTAGRKELDAPLKSRFTVYKELKYPNEEKELELAQHHIGKLTSDEESYVRTAIRIGATLRRTDIEEFEALPYRPTVRETITYAKYIKAGHDPKEAAQRIYVDKYADTGDPEDKRKVDNLVDSAFKKKPTPPPATPSQQPSQPKP